METISSKQSHTNVKDINSLESSNKEELVKYEKLENTPFTIIEKEGYYFLTLGKNLLLEPNKDKEKLIKEVHDKAYDLTLKMICIIMESIKEEKQYKIEQE